MSLLPIHLLGSPTLRQRADEVGNVDMGVERLIQDLFDTMYADSGVGLAANQVGIVRRVAVLHVENEPQLALIDPVILERSGNAREEEGCLSIPELYGDVDRAESILVETTTLDGTRIQLKAGDLQARVIQHEIDHLDGILFIDHLSPLKRRMLLKKWKKLRKGESGYIKQLSPVKAGD